MGVGLAPLPRKKKLRCYRNTNDKSTNSTSSGRRRASLAKVHDELQGKPKGTCNADYPSVDQKNIKHRNLEHQNNVRVREDSPGSWRNAQLWLGHTLRKPPSCIGHQVLNWNPQRQRRRGRPRNTWRRELEKDIKRTGYTWKQLERIAQDRGDWRVVIGGLCSGRSKGPK